MKERILDCLRKTNKPESIHAIAQVLGEKEMDVLELLNEMRGEVQLVIVPLNAHGDCSIYYTIRTMTT